MLRHYRTGSARLRRFEDARAHQVATPTCPSRRSTPEPDLTPRPSWFCHPRVTASTRTRGRRVRAVRVPRRGRSAKSEQSDWIDPARRRADAAGDEGDRAWGPAGRTPQAAREAEDGIGRRRRHRRRREPARGGVLHWREATRRCARSAKAALIGPPRPTVARLLAAHDAMRHVTGRSRACSARTGTLAARR